MPAPKRYGILGRTLNEAIQAEPVAERDRMMHDMLRPLGEKGEHFERRLMAWDLRASRCHGCEAMVKGTIDFNKTERFATRSLR